MISGRERIVESQVIITSSGNTPLTHGAQVIQVQSGPGPTLTDAGYLLDPSSMKSEPKDLSFSVTPGPRGEAEAGDMRRSIDLEAGTQASEAMVQNMLWSLKDSDKTITNQILPSPAQRHDPCQVPAVDNGPQGREAELWPRRQPHLVLRRHNGEQ